MDSDLKEKFSGINVESDTIIQDFRFLTVSGIDCRYEMWSWDGIKGESLIFCTKELESTNEHYLKSLLSNFLEKNIPEDFEMTLKILETYTLINFNFKISS